MLPFIRDGLDTIVLAPAATLNVGQIVLARLAAGSYVLHRIVAISGADLTLMGDGNLRSTESCTAASVIAQVVEIHRNGHTIRPNSRAQQRLARLWRILRPIRRPILFIYKRLWNIAN